MIATKIENVWKEYRLGVIGYGTLVNDLQSWWARVRGRDDPNRKIQPTKNQVAQIDGDQFWALRGVNLEIKIGDIWGIIGRNGAGKSTLLKILSRVTAPTRGTVKIKGRIASLLEVGTGFHPELTGRENVFLNGAILGMSKHDIRLKLEEIVAFSGVEQYLDTPVKRYSSGMRVRLAFAVAAHLEPEILIIDEVLAVGDMAFQKKCLGKMQNISEEGRTIIFVSHNMASIKRLCSRAALIEDGIIKETGSPDSIINSYLADSQVMQSCVTLPKVDGAVATFEEVKIEVPGMGSSSHIPCDKPFSIVVQFTITQTVYRSQVAIAFISNNNFEPVFVTTSADMDDEHDHLIHPGHYQSHVQIPPNFLNIGQYHINLRIWGALEHDIRKSHAAAMGALSFKIEETGSTGSKLGDNRRGYVTPLFKWDIVSKG